MIDNVIDEMPPNAPVNATDIYWTITPDDRLYFNRVAISRLLPT